MKIVFIIPGAGDSFYCGNCFRDNLQATALRKLGHDVIVMPLYLPIKDEAVKTDSPLFFPATTYYVAQKFFQRINMPRWMKRLFGSDSMLKWASSMSGTTSAKGMEEMTLSMIDGDDHAFSEEVNRLINWLKHHEKPDVIHLSSTLLIGIAKAIKDQMNVPIVCSVLDEEVWIDSMDLKSSGLAWNSISHNLQYLDRIVTTSNYYKSFIINKFPQLNNVDVIYPGVDTAIYKASAPPKDPTIGFFYRMNRENGLDILAKAFVLLKKKNSIPHLKLKIGGGFTSKDKKFVREVKRLLKPFISDVEFVSAYSMGNHPSFYQSISVISVPITFDEGFGLYLCEAYACGVPSVEPATGSFSEIVGDAGVLYNPNTPEQLASALESLLVDKEAYHKAAGAALKKASTLFNDRVMAEKLHHIYQSIIKN